MARDREQIELEIAHHKRMYEHYGRRAKQHWREVMDLVREREALDKDDFR